MDKLIGNMCSIPGGQPSSGHDQPQACRPSGGVARHSACPPAICSFAAGERFHDILTAADPEMSHLLIIFAENGVNSAYDNKVLDNNAEKHAFNIFLAFVAIAMAQQG